MEWYIYLAVVLAGFLAGFINTLAGSGSLIALPMLMAAGLPANIANGTNRIAILLQSMVAVGSFKQQKILDTQNNWRLVIITVIGSIAGARLAIQLDEYWMRLSIGLLMLVMFFIIWLKPEAWIKGHAGQIHPKPGIIQILVFFVIGVYGGFIQAGVGFFLLAGLVLGSGLNLLKANAIKVLITLIYTPFALAVFIWHNQIDWVLGLVLSAGSMVGAWVAAHYASSWGTRFIRIFLLLVILVASAELLGVFKLINSLLSGLW